MAKSFYLSEKEKKNGQKHMFREEIYNGISYNLLGGTFVYLLAVYFNASNLALGYISSVLYIAGAILPFVPRIFNSKNIIKIQSRAWFYRGVVSLFYLALLFVDRKYAVLILLIIYSLFSVFRVIGIALNDFTIKSLSNSSNLGRLVGNINVAYQTAAILVCCLSAVYLDLFSLYGILPIIILQMIGVVFNSFSAYEMAKIPCRRNINFVKGQGLVKIFISSMKEEHFRRRLIMRWLSSALVVGFSMVVPFLKIYSNFNDSAILFYTAACAISSLIAGVVNKQLSDRLGSKPICLISSIAFLFFNLAWIIVPNNMSAYFFFTLGVFSNFFLLVAYFSVFRLISAVIPDKDAISFNSMNNFVIAIVAFIAGIINGLLANYDIKLLFNDSVFFNNYSYMFAFMFILNLIFIFYSARLKEFGAYSSTQTAKILLSRHGIQAISRIEKLSHTFDPYRRRLLLFSLGTNTNTLATSQLKTILAAPYSYDKKEIIRSLTLRPRKALLNDLIVLAKNDEESAQIEAIIALGSYKKNEIAIKVLIDLLNSKWSSVRSVASRSLSKIDPNPKYLKKINELALKAVHIDEEIDFLIAKKNLDKEGFFYEDFFLSVDQKRGNTFRQTRYALLASFLHFETTNLAYLYGQMNLGNYNNSIVSFVNDILDIDYVCTNYDNIINAFEVIDIEELKKISLNILNLTSPKSKAINHLKEGLMKVENYYIQDLDIIDMIALFYFSQAVAKY